MNEPETSAQSPNETSAGDAQPFNPVTERQRLSSVDVIRGVALLGILTMNIVAFALPFTLYVNPAALGPLSPADWTSWAISHLLFEQKFMAIFSMLFGAGLVLMWERAEASGSPILGVWMRRNLWLILIGLLHGFLLWFGDILFVYGACGLLIYFFRRFRPRTLAVVGLLLITAFLIPLTLQGRYFDSLRAGHQQALEKLEAGEELSEAEQQLKQGWIQLQDGFKPGREKLQESIEVYRNGTYLQQIVHRAPVFLQVGPLGFLTFGLWRAGGLMLLGMALMKWGVFSAALSRAAYLRLVFGGYLLGLPFAAWSVFRLTEHHHDPLKLFGGDMYINYFASVPIALGHVGLVMLLCKSALGQRLKERLAAVGRMAFTNYLMQTILCTAIFYGSYGLGLFGYYGRTELWLFVLAVWIVELTYSPLWLRHFRFGPAEWLWRSLTYFKLQPMRKSA